MWFAWEVDAITKVAADGGSYKWGWNLEYSMGMWYWTK